MMAEINKLLLDIAPMFYMLVYMSLVASLVGLAILVIKQLFGKKLSPKVNGILWIVFVLALIIPIRFESSFSIYNIMPLDISYIANTSYRAEYDNIKYIDMLAREDALVSELNSNDVKDAGLGYGYTKYVDESGTVNLGMIEADKNVAYIKSLIFDCILPGIYVLGIVGIGIFSVGSFAIFCRRIGKKYVSDSRVLGILNMCRSKLGIKRDIKLVEQSVVRVPSLFGIFKPQILVCDNIYDMTDEQIKHICMHELAHYTKHDLFKNILFNVFQIVYWFNPLIHLCFRHIRKDMEVTTDDVAISHLPDEEHKAYCRTLVAVSCNDNSRLANRVLGISNDKKGLEGRISMIKNSEKFSKNKWIIGGIGLVLIIALAVVFCTSKLSLVPPDMYATVDGKEYVEFVRGGYSWNTMFESVVADAPMLIDFDYTSESTIYVGVGDTLGLSNVKNTFSFGGNDFNITDARYYSTQDLIGIKPESMETVEYEKVELSDKNGNVYRNMSVPEDVGTYILTIDADYGAKGTVQYGIKVVVGYSVEKLKEYSNTYIGDASRVNSILRMIAYSQNLNGIELHTANEPYGLTVNYKDRYLYEKELEFNTVVLFSLIQNLSYIEYVIHNDDGQYIVNVDRSDYADIATLNYEGLVEYVRTAEQRELVELLKEVYLPMYTHVYSYRDFVVDSLSSDIVLTNEEIDSRVDSTQKDSLIMESIIWGYYMAKRDAIRYEGEYPSEIVRTAYEEMLGREMEADIAGLGIYPYVKDKDYFHVAADWNMPMVTKVNKVESIPGGYVIEYEYCYPSESDIFNLPMIEDGEGSATLNKEVYEKYIDGLKKYTAKVQLSENGVYAFFRWHMDEMERM